MNRKIKKIGLYLVIGFALFSCKDKREKTERYLQHFIKKHVKDTKRFFVEKNLAHWNALTSGDNDAFRRYEELEIALMEKIVNRNDYYSELGMNDHFAGYLYNSYEDFEYIKKVRKSGYIEDTLLQRQLEMLYQNFLYAQLQLNKSSLEDTLTKKASSIFRHYKPVFFDEEKSLNELFQLYYHAQDIDTLKQAWDGIMKVADSSAFYVKKAIEARNKSAKALGFKNYYKLRLFLQEQEINQVKKLLDELDRITIEPYKAIKLKMDSNISAYYNIPIDSIMPWHYQSFSLLRNRRYLDFYQSVEPSDSNNYKEIAKNYFLTIGLPLENIIKKSHITIHDSIKRSYSFTIDIDNSGDARVAVSSKNNTTGVKNLWHNLGHALYDSNIPNKIPFLLREPNIGMNEAIAMFFQQLLVEDPWFRKNNIIGEFQGNDEAIWYYGDVYRILLIRFLQVVVRFEMEMYQNPNQDLDKVYWELVNRYQLVNKPNEYHAKWVFSSYLTRYKCYYQNYLIGITGAAQIKYSLNNEMNPNHSKHSCLSNNPEVTSEFFQELFGYGNSVPWQELVLLTTGDSLDTKYLLMDIEKTFNKTESLPKYQYK